MFASTARRSDLTPAPLALRVAIVGLTLATAWVHSSLGGLLFTLNALGYVAAAVAMIAPFELAIRYRWIVRIGLIGYAAMTIIGWAIQGPYYSTAYVAKAIELLLIATLTIDFVRADGNPIDVIRRDLGSLLARLTSRKGSKPAGA